MGQVHWHAAASKLSPWVPEGLSWLLYRPRAVPLCQANLGPARTWSVYKRLVDYAINVMHKLALEFDAFVEYEWVA